MSGPSPDVGRRVVASWSTAPHSQTGVVVAVSPFLGYAVKWDDRPEAEAARFYQLARPGAQHGVRFAD